MDRLSHLWGLMGHHAPGRFVENEALQRIDVAGPRRLGEDALGVRVTRVPACTNAGWAEVDVLGMVLALQRRCPQADHPHAGPATKGGPPPRGLPGAPPLP